jgi:multicomponent Na+:H+ antiporter subunit G
MELISSAFFVVGMAFMFFGTLGVIRFPDVYTRLQSSSKCDAAGVISILIGLMLGEGFSIVSLRILVIMVFLLLTNPVATHAIARSAAKRKIRPWRIK